MAGNPVKVQLLAPALSKQVFGPPAATHETADTDKRTAIAVTHLEKQGIWGKKSEPQQPIAFQCPDLLGKDIEDHFIRIGLEQSGSYLDKAERFANAKLPKKPKKWHLQSGWTRYDKDGTTTRVDRPGEDVLAFDVEVLVSEGHYPVLAVAASEKAWYGWVSPFLADNDASSHHLIPLAHPNNDRLVIGHNVGYDRARIADEYTVQPTHLRYIDTMSLHVAVSGLCSQQRPAWIKRRKEKESKALSDTESDSGTSINTTGEELDRIGAGEAAFFDVSSLNSLKDVAKFYCKIDIDKSQRSYFETGTRQDILDHFQEAMTYCAGDVDMTHAVYKTVFPKFRHNCPHPVSFAGMLHMGSSFLTVNEKWETYLARSVQKHQELNDLLDTKLQDLADKARALVDTPEERIHDPWLSQLDWEVNPRQRKLKGSPKWYKDAYDTKAGKLKITTRSRLAPLLLRLKWKNHPLHHLPQYGWCYKIHRDHPDFILASPKAVTHEVDDEGYIYIKVPHKDGEKANCGNPLAKGYISAFEDKLLTSEYEAARQALDMNAQSAYWISSRERILGQFVVWDDLVNMGLEKRPQGKYGMILPQMITMGTVTRRAVEKTWLTASNAKKNRIGSELKSMVEAPAGYKIVGADVDSEELWISSVIGDAQFGFHGASALGWMTLQGTKSEGTDLHSKTASILGISRDKAKIFNYARIYGAGVKYATSLLMQYSQDMDMQTAKERATQLYLDTKGDKQHSRENPFKRQYWRGGTESYMFNALEDVALSPEPRTPVLGCAITAALRPENTGSQFLTSRINWVVQSSGVDYLHLLITSMAHLIQRYQIEARFMLSVHDEVRYLSTERDTQRTALALQVANLWTRALFSYKLGILNLPQSVAFFSAVDIDHVLRKEPTMPCTTPSHEEAIPEGRSVTIQDTLAELEAFWGKKEPQACLLGPETPTPGSEFAADVIEGLRNTHGLSQPRKLADIDFLKAQLGTEYSFESKDPSVRGGRQTEERVSAETEVARPRRKKEKSPAKEVQSVSTSKESRKKLKERVATPSNAAETRPEARTRPIVLKKPILFAGKDMHSPPLKMPVVYGYEPGFEPETAYEYINPSSTTTNDYSGYEQPFYTPPQSGSSSTAWARDSSGRKHRFTVTKSTQ